MTNIKTSLNCFDLSVSLKSAMAITSRSITRRKIAPIKSNNDLSNIIRMNLKFIFNSLREDTDLILTTT